MPAPIHRRPSPGRPSTERVRGIFSGIAGDYDRVNAVASLGIDRLWRHAAVRLAEVHPSSRVLDLCCGTGELALAMARRGRPAEVVATDFVPEMLALARAKAEAISPGPPVRFEPADAQDLPYEDESFDVATVGFGVRNLPDRAANFREVHRVLKPGGRYVVLEFSRPPFAPFRSVYRWYLRTVIPWLGGVLAGDRASYQYLNDSILEFPGQVALAAELHAAGFSNVSWRNMTFGVVAVHIARK